MAVVVLWLTLSVVAPDLLGAAPAGGSSPSRRTIEGKQPLLVLRVAGDSLGRSRERRFVIALRLELDEVSVRVVQPKRSDFARLPLGQQIGLVRPLLKRHRALAVTWINQVSPQLLLLHMVAVSSGNALVRLKESSARRGFEKDLAIVARELLGTAFLFHNVRSSPLARVVRRVRNKVASALPPRSNRQPWSILLQARVEGGLVGALGPTVMTGGRLTLERRFLRGLNGRVFLGMSAGPFGATSAWQVKRWRLAAGLGGLYRWTWGPVGLGICVSAGAVWNNLSVTAGSGVTAVHTMWGALLSAGLELKLRLSRVISIVAGVGLSAEPRRASLDRSSTGERVYSTPFLSAYGLLGLLLRM